MIRIGAPLMTTNRHSIEFQEQALSKVRQHHIDAALSKIPMGRFGTPEEIAALVAWACTEECSFTSGATFDLSGGRATY
jgi:NAD(P)-dependent dehydrogenase (short-subunit alcohol dehydrogenase family)